MLNGIKKFFRFKQDSIDLQNPSMTTTSLFGSPTKAGQNVTAESAQRLAAVNSCLRVLSQNIAQLPCKVYQTDDEGRTEKQDHPVYKLIHKRSNSSMPSFNFWELMVRRLLSQGNAYALVETNGAGVPTALWPLLPSRVSVYVDTTYGFVSYYKVKTGNTNDFYVNPAEMLHIVGPGDGYVGQSVISSAAETIGIGLAADEYSGTYFANAAHPQGILEHPAKLSKEAGERLKQSWKDAHSGISKHGTAILEEGMTFKEVSVKPEDAQLIETRKFNRSEIAGIFGVPPHMIADLEHATYSNIEQQSMEFAKYSLGPWLRRIEQAVNMKLFPRGPYYIEFVVDGLLRGDIEGRNRAHQIAIQGGWKSINEVRREENMRPIEGGDEHFMQQQMTPIRLLKNEHSQSEGGEANNGGQQGEPSDDNE